MSYTAANIKILNDDEISGRFEWSEIPALAAKYRRSEDWIRRGFVSCQLVGVDPVYFVRRYLDEDDIPEHEGVTEAFRTLFWPQRK